MISNAKCGADRLSYPVLCLSRDTSISVAETEERLEQCNARAFFTNRYFDDLILLDANAQVFMVVASQPAQPLTGVSLWWARIRNAKFAVRLQLEKTAPASLEAAKERVVIWLEKSPEFWEASRDLDEWKRLVRNARDMRQLVALFA